jgi:Double-GTPase 2
VKHLADLMRKLDLEPTEEDVLDVLWLASRIGQPTTGSPRDEEEGPGPPPVTTNATAQAEDEPLRDHAPSMPRAPSEPEDSRREAGQAPSLYLMNLARTGDRQAAPIRAPAASALGDQLGLSRALRPLKRKRPSRHVRNLDEEATATRIAEERLWIPAMRPAPARWLELAVVVDGYESMSIWRQLISEFRAVLEGLGAFSDVRFWILGQIGGDPPRPGVRRGGPYSPLRSAGELRDPVGRRAVIVISDCLGPLWRSGSAQRQLADWGRSQPVAILQPLPQRLWAYSHARPVPVTLRAPRAGAPNSQLACEGWVPAGGPVRNPVPVPVLELSADWLASWSRLVSASGTSGVSSMAVLTSHEDAPAGGAVTARETSSDPRALVQRFRATVSPEAFQLAVYLAAVPISLPVIRLVQRAMLKTPQLSQVAEVFLGGLLRRKDREIVADPDMVQYEFATDEVREILLRRLRRNDAIKVLLAVSEFMDVRFGQARDFRALLAGRNVAGDYLVNEDSRPFALVAERVLRRLGGQYIAPADCLAAALDGQQGNDAPAPPRVSQPVPRSTQHPLVCPYCYHAFAERDIRFRCSGRARVGRTPCKPERDETLEELMGETASLLPPVFHPGKPADEAACPRCGQPTRAQICPRCHSRLPAAFRSVQGRLIALAGPSLAGKTAFMTVLIHELRHRAGELLNAATTGADERTHERFVRDYESPLYRKSLLFTRTTTAGQDYIQPLVFRFMLDQQSLLRRRPKELLLSFADGAGEDLVSPDKVELMTRYLGAADAVVALIDPLQFPPVRDALGRGNALPPVLKPDQISAFEKITGLLLEGSGRTVIDKPVAIVVTKLDEVQGLLAPDSVLRAPAELSPYFNQPDSAAVQEQVEYMLSEWGAARLIQVVRENYGCSRFFAVSSLGFPPVSKNRVAPQGIQPYRVTDPFIWLLNQFSFVPSQ